MDEPPPLNSSSKRHAQLRAGTRQPPRGFPPITFIRSVTGSPISPESSISFARTYGG